MEFDWINELLGMEERHVLVVFLLCYLFLFNVLLNCLVMNKNWDEWWTSV